MKNIAPVLLIYFNRPECLEKTFSSIRKVKPEKLYLFHDGPRTDRADDVKKINECEKIVSNIDWPCIIKTNYNKENLGCGVGPYTAINWVFEFEECAIVLEDDCVASESFFPFCTEMLERFKNDQRIFMITGCNLEIKSDVSSSYFFGYSGTNWGWATWKRNWKEMDFECKFVEHKEEFKMLSKFLKHIEGLKGTIEAKCFSETHNKLMEKENVNYWDVQWQATRYLNHQLSIIPQKNLITNIGLGPNSTHAKKRRIPAKNYSTPGVVHFCYNQNYELIFPLIHPTYLIQNTAYDNLVDKALTPSFSTRIKKIIKKYIRK